MATYGLLSLLLMLTSHLRVLTKKFCHVSLVGVNEMLSLAILFGIHVKVGDCQELLDEKSQQNHVTIANKSPVFIYLASDVLSPNFPDDFPLPDSWMTRVDQVSVCIFE